MKRRSTAAISFEIFQLHTLYPSACYYIPLYSLILGILIIVSSQSMIPILVTDINT